MKQQASLNPFENKVVLITGGTAGIGRATAIAFAEQGARVVVTGRREAEGAESVALIEQAGSKGIFVRGDVSREEDSAEAVSRALEQYGRLDFAFNNAGVSLESGAFTETSGDVFDSIMNINVRGVFFGMKHQIPALLKSGGGAIVNNASVLGIRPTGRNRFTTRASLPLSVLRNRWRSSMRARAFASMRCVLRLPRRI